MYNTEDVHSVLVAILLGDPKLFIYLFLFIYFFAREAYCKLDDPAELYICK